MHKVPSPRAFTENNKNKNSKDDCVHIICAHRKFIEHMKKKTDTDICGGRRPGDWLSRCSAPCGGQEAASTQNHSLNKKKVFVS